MEHKLRAGLEHAFINGGSEATSYFKPQFISNDYKQGKKVLSTIEEELLQCEEFFISVAFITTSGLTPLLPVLEILERKGIKGRILTTSYLDFTEPTALTKLEKFKNIQLKMYSSDKEGFHTKGYIFKKKGIVKAIVGSSNMTQSALTKNKEWNTKIVSTQQGEFTKDLISEFEKLWESENAQEYDCFIHEYTQRYLMRKQQNKEAIRKRTTLSDRLVIKPNSMQRMFINNLNELIKNNEKRALLVSATGTGKTFASAFALRQINPKRVLFIVHREQIAIKSMESYKQIFGSTKSFGVLSGNKKETDKDYVFATMQTLSKTETLNRFKLDEFDFIIIDEVHRAGANSYQKIINYFTPKFYLGMSASPERLDGFDIYKLFDNNIVYEIRLQQAMEDDLLCPFHYFGITDLTLDEKMEKNIKQFNRINQKKRVDYIIEKSEYYGYSGNRVKGLVFCSTKKEAMELSNLFNEKKYSTVFLSGDDTQEKRVEAIERLTDDSRTDCIDYIFSVDIFNEGVDIPEINQVIMLRPTESPIVFVQQLGRGLRKSVCKDFVVILDFIGNYTTNFMIPIALSGDRTYNKDNLRRYVLEGERVMPGCSTIHFDEIAKKKIFQSIDAADFNQVKLLKDNYFNLKHKLGHIPKLSDFDLYGEVDVLRIFENGSIGSYYNFLVKYEEEYCVRLNVIEEKMIKFISTKLASGKRMHELIMLQLILESPYQLIKRLKDYLYHHYELALLDTTQTNLIHVLTHEFISGTGKDKYKGCEFIEVVSNEVEASSIFMKALENANFKTMIDELLKFGMKRYHRDYNQYYKNTNLVLYKKYTYEDVCRLLNWEKSEVALNIGGYKFNKKTNTFPVFINYHKGNDISDTIKYEDQFVSQSMLIAISKNGRTLESEDVQNFIFAKERGIEVELFVRKNKDDKGSKEFYYLGRMYYAGNVKAFVQSGTGKNLVSIDWKLDVPVRDDIYKFITSD